MILFLSGALTGLVTMAGLVALALTAGPARGAFYTDDPDELPPPL